MASPLVGADWLAERLGAPDLVAIDGSWHMPATGRDPEAEYRAAHIPGAVFFPIDEIADRGSGLPHMLPSPALFEEAMARLGIREDMTAVVYDSIGLFSAPRVWWTLRIFGMARVFVLDGGLPKWRDKGRPIEEGPVVRPRTAFIARFDRPSVLDAGSIAQAMRAGSPQIVDARASDRFRGEAPEPRPSLPSGHIPGSLNLPWTDLVEDGRLVDGDKIRAVFESIGLDWSKPIATTCGSGVSAATLSLALDAIGRPSALYDGSWTDWASRPDCPIATG